MSARRPPAGSGGTRGPRPGGPPTSCRGSAAANSSTIDTRKRLRYIGRVEGDMERAELEPLEAERVEMRVAIIDGVDSQACQGCGVEIPAGAASDPGWYMDTEMTPEKDCLATILCPKCW